MDFELLPHQDEFIFSDKRFCCLDGGMGNGKSLAWMIKLALHCQQNPGTKTGVFRQELVDLTRSTIPEFKDIFGDFGNYNGTDHLFTFHNGSTILFHQLSELTKLKNHNFSAAVFEQAEETTEEAFFTIFSRLRRADADRRWLSIVSNPEGHDWIWKIFIKGDIGSPDKEAQKELEDMDMQAPTPEDFHYICADTFANKENLPDDYLQSLLAQPEHMRKKYVYASRDVLEGAVYSMIDPKIHRVESFEIPSDWPKWTTMDYGSQNPTAHLWITKDYEGNIYVYREHYKKQGDDGKPWLVSQHANAIRGPENDKNNTVCPYPETIKQRYIDPACSSKTREKNNRKISVIEEFEEEGIYFTPWRQAKSKKEKLAQVNTVAELFQPSEERTHPRTDESPAPKLYIMDNCPNTWEEHTQLRWKKQSTRNQGEKNLPETPRKKDDHTCDALRGFCSEKFPDPKREKNLAPPGSFSYIRNNQIRKKNKRNGKSFNFNL